MTQRAPDVRYVTTRDGASIACWSVGRGPPLVITQNFSLSHAELEWEVESLRRFYLALAPRYEVVRYDPRMSGVSDRALRSTSLEAMCLDLDAVVLAFGHDVFALMGVNTLTPVAIEFAATRPEKVSALVLCEPLTVPGASTQARDLRSSLALAEAESAEYAMAVYGPHFWGSDKDSDVLERMAASAYENTDPAFLEWDATQRLDQLRCPTLIMTATGAVVGDVAQARQIAATVPGTRLVRIEGRAAPYFADQEVALATIGEHVDGTGIATRPTAGGLRAVVFTDLVDSTAFTNAVGDTAAREEVRRIESLIASRASAHEGRVVKHLGDGSMLVFDSPTASVEFALDVQSDLEESELELRIGIAVGEPLEEEGDLHGAVVNLAARIAAEAAPGRILVSDGTRQLLVGKPFTYEHVVDRQIKGFDEPIGLYEIGLRD